MFEAVSIQFDTYWEEDIPPRIDLGKSKYGGPFTTEEVEDVKTFLLLSLVLGSLFGFHLVDNGYFVVQQLNYKLCPSAIVQASVSLSPNILQTVTVMVCSYSSLCSPTMTASIHSTHARNRLSTDVLPRASGNGYCAIFLGGI